MPRNVSEEELFSKKAVFIRILNSTLFFILTYVITIFLFRIFKAFGGWWFECDPVFHYHGVAFDITYEEWYLKGRKAVTGVFGSGPLGSLILGGIGMFIYDLIEHKSLWLKLFVLWLSIHLLMNFLGKVVVAPLEESTGVGILLRWYYISTNAQLVISLVTLVGIFTIGMLLRKPFLEMAPSTRLVRTLSLRKKYLWEIGLLPSIIGSVPAVLFNLPNQYYQEEDYLILVCIISLMLSCYFFTAQIHKPVRAYKNKIPKNINYWALAAILALFVLFNYVWKAGIELY